MMTRTQLLLIKLAEEASEVSQIALKTAQFGPHEVKPGQDDTNFQRIRIELDDLLAIVEMLNDECLFGYQPDRDAAKKTRVDKYAAYSYELGLVEAA
ncbi:MAG: hypothetical protein H6948_01150 [Zoogloeaceae bacterium]|nr:hypothetical protein [Zoogloeaceae bacterium]